ncbi:NAD(P)/FAD-dependent oxidoreductase [Conexibacter sp. DBS9H8]|uniref:NAD(P)/FAD-dependent oxidoreductase n=1 Tax=Conexibacter sp. DBS9H8 TaxID=2937801 RepID=UPI00200D362B|nr:FAD-dependent oxidoreductase [Conexibacter sp. DBS9H8]
MNIAVVGAGVSGLVAALLLSEDHEVTVFEAAAHPGGHTNTVEVETERGRWAVDTGFIVFNDRNYPNFERLLARLGVGSQPSDMSFSVADPDGRFEYSSTSLRGLYATPANRRDPRFHRMVLEVPRFQRVCRRLLASGANPGRSLTALLADEGFSDFFITRLIVPQAAAVWSADPADMDRFPARFLAEFFANHGMLSLTHRPQWSTVRGGSRSYVRAICERLGDRVRLRSPVTAIRRVPDGVTVSTAGRTETEPFDEVVIATHSDQALALLADPTPREQELLSAVPYQPNEAVLHTDTSLLPRHRQAWASWNYHLLDPPAPRAAVTYHMNRLQSLTADREFCVTLNHSDAIDPELVIARFSYAHPIYTPAGIAAQARVGEISGVNHTHYCGAYWGWGFHEDGVLSALRVTERFGARL